MAYTLLDATNLLLKRVKIIAGASGALTSLTDSPRQTMVDTAVQVINESIHELYSETERPLPLESETANITLTNGNREYPLPADLEKIRYPLLDTTHGQYVYEYDGGYEQMRKDQPQPGNYTGLPYFATINPATGMLRFERAATSVEAGRIYELFYDKRLSLALAADTFPFSDTVVDSLVPCWAEDWNRSQKRSFDEKKRNTAFAQACRYLTQKPLRRSW